jgi:WD40 repeat protein
MIRVWDAQNGQELAALRWHDQAINEVHFGGDDQTILSASDDGTVSLGRCEACSQTVSELRKRAMDEAILPDDELREIAQEKRVRPSYLRLPALFSSNH